MRSQDKSVSSKGLPTRVKLIALILLGSLTWSLTTVKSGLETAWGLGFWGANGHDGIWHIALTNSLSRGSLEMPTFAGMPLQNYHIGFDLVLAFIHRITSIPVSILYFQGIPPILAITIGILTYCFVYKWRHSERAALWSTFFIYFGGSFGWIVTLFRGQGLGGESMFWAQQSISTLINPPFALSIVILLTGLLLLQKFMVKPTLLTFVFASLAFGTLIEIKAYAGILALGALFLSAIYQFFISKNKKGSLIFLLFLISLVLSIILFLPLNGRAGSLISVSPFWFLETLLALSDRFYWPKLYEAIFNWKSAHAYHKLLVGYGVALVLFIVGNLGTRVVAIFPAFKQLKQRKIDIFDVFLFAMIGGGILAPLLFVQEGTAWNTIQFLYYSLFFLSIYMGFLMENLASRAKVISLIIVALTLPTTFSTLVTVYLPSRPPASLPTSEMEALRFLSKEPQGVVFTFPFDAYKAREAESNPPRPLYLYDSTAYVSAFSNKPVYLEDEVNLTIMGYKWKDRRAQIEDFYKSNDHALTREFLRKNNITYVYWVKPQRAVPGDFQLGLTQIFENKDVYIYRVIQ